MKSFGEAKRIVVKVGSSTLTHTTGKPNLRRIDELARVLSDLKNSGREVILVSSGAVSAGIAKLGVDHRPRSTEEKQALAAVGQSELMSLYSHFFGLYGQTVAQILATKEIVDVPAMRRNAENTFRTLLGMNCIPIVNENDTVSSEEIEFGDNDTLSAYVAIVSGADVIVNMSDIDGLYDSDPRKNPDAKLIRHVSVIDDTILSYAGGAGSSAGTGGVVTKLRAARLALDSDISMFLVNGEDPRILFELIDGKTVGTYFGG